MAWWLVLFLCREWSGSFGSSKTGRGPATKLHPHLIALGLYVGSTEGSRATEENRAKREEIEGQGQ